MGQVQPTKRSNWQQKLDVSTWISFFLLSLINACSLERSRPNRFHSHYCLFLMLFSAASCVLESYWVWRLAVDIEILICMMSLSDHTIICRSGYILVLGRGYLSLTRLESTNENRRWKRKWRQSSLRVLSGLQSFSFLFHGLTSQSYLCQA